MDGKGAEASAVPVRTPQRALDPYRFPGLRDLDRRGTAGAVDGAEGRFLPAPDLRRRPLLIPSAADKRRLDLHAALTASGIAPLPGDLEAVHVLSALDDITIGAVLRWITSPWPVRPAPTGESPHPPGWAITYPEPGAGRHDHTGPAPHHPSGRQLQDGNSPWEC
ncbi:hypothetical protein [Streptomyces sp. Wb2n-11]|uniref:hypothetical protein n=1 Tax=Streptomyces sp. Wb2n-11 TaxID=1030533 RepID=UPI000ABFCCBF|nr:hypothetical protein [Streptomyces sp. Wb2n-11]